MSTVLVTGGAGYIGSHTVRHLLEAGYGVVVVDDLSAGHRSALPADVQLVELDLKDAAATSAVLAEVGPDAVVHFAGSIEAGESMTDPRRFWHNNLLASINVADAVVDAGGPPFVFSSTAAVYGEPAKQPIAEDDPTEPTNVYGDSKLAFERVLRSYDRAYALRSISLRYFNACGAHPSGDIGADHRNKTHLITIALLTALGQRPAIKVFGTDYPTPDGTCIRDYIHVEDLATAHVLAVEVLLAGGRTTAYNVGVGRGFSVTEVLDAVDRVTGIAVPRDLAPRREGDPSALVADASLLRADLGWSPRYLDLDEIVETAWRWHSSHPDGFPD